MLNRGVLIVHPRRPFLDWAAALDASGLVPNVEGEQTVYLLPSFEDDAEAERVLRRVFGAVFESERHAWWTDESAWPEKRTFRVFQQWFTIEMYSLVHDLGRNALHDDDAE